MNTLGRLDDGTIVSLWTNTMALPENATAGNGTWEDVFTNRDSHHIAMSGDEGKTWYGFREIILDEHRNHPGYATLDGPEDRGKHQSEMVQLDKNRILISLGQHKNHRRLVIVDRRWVRAKTRATQTGKDLDSQWTIHTYIPHKKAIAVITASLPPSWFRIRPGARRRCCKSSVWMIPNWSMKIQCGLPGRRSYLELSERDHGVGQIPLPCSGRGAGG